MSKKSNSALRGPVHQPDSFKRFLSENVRPPTNPEAIAALDEPAPEPERVQHEDILSPAARGLRSAFDQGPGVTEVHGAAYAPQTVFRHSRANSPAPTVSTSHPSAHPYTPAGGTGKVVYLPTGVNLPTGVDPCE